MRRAPGPRPMLGRGSPSTVPWAVTALLACTACLPGTASSGETDRGLVLTLVPAGSAGPGRAARLSPTQRYPVGSRVVSLIPGSHEAPQLLSAGLAAAGGADVSPDGQKIVYAARSTEESRWAIYEVSRHDSTPRAIVQTSRDCIDPAYLAGDWLVFACAATSASENPDAAPVWSLFVARRDGSEPEQITFGVASAFDPTALADGRILFVMQRSSGESGPQGTDLFTVNPDGTLLEPFGDSHEDPDFRYRPRQTRDGGVLFLAAAPGEEHARLLRLEMNRPAEATVVGVGAPSAGHDIGAAVFRMLSPELVTELMGAIDGLVPIEAVPMVPASPPRGRPRIVDEARETGLLVGYDAGRSDGAVGPPQGSPAPHTVRFQTLRAGRAPLLTPGGTAVRADRSFFLEVPADVPLRVTTLAASGEPIATSSWFWVRPGETRACFGCHEGHAAAPVNRPIEAISQPPVELVLAPEATRKGGSQ